jgi:hypothetical protein
VVHGIDIFSKYFADDKDHYTIIGGTACSIWMESQELDFRMTKDIDMVLVVEALDERFASKFWTFIHEGGYLRNQKDAGQRPSAYRFQSPADKQYPSCIELFSRNPEGFPAPPSAYKIPVHVSDTVSDLSAILIDDDYYTFLLGGRDIISGVPLLKPTHLIIFKAKAWLNQIALREQGIKIQSGDIDKHKNDVFRLWQLIPKNTRIALPASIKKDFDKFITALEGIEVNLSSIGVIAEIEKNGILVELRRFFGQ